MLNWNKNKQNLAGLNNLPPLIKIFSKKFDKKQNFLLWGHNLITVIKGLKFSNERCKIPKDYQIILIDLPYKEESEDKASILKRPNLYDPNKFHNFYNPIGLPAEVYFKGSIEEYFTNLESLIKETWDLLSEQGFFIIKYIGRYRHYLKILLDNTLGYDKFLNEVFIQSPFYQKNSDDSNSLTKEVTSCFFIYTKSENPKIIPSYKEKESGGYWHTMHSKGQGPPRIFKINGKEHKIAPPVGSHWKFKQATIDKRCANGTIKLNTEGKPVYWVEPKQGHIVDNNWLDLEAFALSHLGWELQDKVYERIIQSFSEENGILLHIFVGSGTCAKVTTELNRNYVGIDPRMLGISLCQNFFITNKFSIESIAIGSYQYDYIEEYFENGFIEFICKLLNAKVISNSLIFSAIYNNSLLHISPPHHTFTAHELEICISEFGDFKHIFESFIIIAPDFLEDEKWDQLKSELSNKRQKVQFWKLEQIWEKSKTNGIFLKAPVVEVNMDIINSEFKCEIEDFFFLNDQIISLKIIEFDHTKLTFGRLSHWILQLLDNRGNIVFSKIFHRKIDVLNLEKLIKITLEKEIKLIKLEIYDICGACYKLEKGT